MDLANSACFGISQLAGGLPTCPHHHRHPFPSLCSCSAVSIREPPVGNAWLVFYGISVLQKNPFVSGPIPSQHWCSIGAVRLLGKCHELFLALFKFLAWRWRWEGFVYDSHTVMFVKLIKAGVQMHKGSKFQKWQSRKSAQTLHNFCPVNCVMLFHNSQLFTPISIDKYVHYTNP